MHAFIHKCHLKKEMTLQNGNWLRLNLMKQMMMKGSRYISFCIQKGQPHLPETYLIKFSRFLQYLCKILL